MALSDVLAGRLPDLDVDVHAPVAAGIQPVSQRQQGRGFPRLAGCVQHEVALVADEPKQIVQIQAVQRRDAVVVRRHHRAGRVEETHAAESGDMGPQRAAADVGSRVRP